jgi:hypothetical protein
VNFSGDRDLEIYHGKAVALDINDRHAPFPSLFIIHEMRVRGFNPFARVNPTIPAQIGWQDWILTEGVFDRDSNTFFRTKKSGDHSGNIGIQSHTHNQFTTSNPGSGSAGGTTLDLTSAVIEEILAATRHSETWRACQIEGTKWTGTAEEHVATYASFVEAQESRHLPPLDVNLIKLSGYAS